MDQNICSLEGEVHIPTQKKKEFNESVLKLLYVCGIRKIEKILLEGKEVIVNTVPKPNNKGIVYFDYSIFEKKVRKICSYDTNTCQLDAPESGNYEFGAAMCLLMAMQESYTAGHCYLMRENKPCNVIIPAPSEPPVRTLRATIPENESH